jgi:hypothetical protein
LESPKAITLRKRQGDMSEKNPDRPCDNEKMHALEELKAALLCLSSRVNLPIRDRAMVLQAIEKIDSEQYESVN